MRHLSIFKMVETAQRSVLYKVQPATYLPLRYQHIMLCKNMLLKGMLQCLLWLLLQAMLCADMFEEPFDIKGI